MAKINVELDTKDNTFKVSLDGKDIPGVCYLNMRKGDEYYPAGVSIEVDETEEDSDVKIMKFISANKIDSIVVAKKNTQVNKDIMECFK